jgi:hypothetical protein
VTIHDFDRMFSRLIRTRANWTCAYCDKSFHWAHSRLECSHFHGRRLKSVRFDPENAEALCWECHRYLDTHPRLHEEWKRKRLGGERFEGLRLRAQMIVKPDLMAIYESIREVAAGLGMT